MNTAAYRQVGSAWGAAREVYPALAASLLLHLIVLVLLLSGSVGIVATGSAPEIVVISLGSVPVNWESALVSDAVNAQSKEAQRPEVIPDSAGSDSPRIKRKRETAEEPVVAPVKTPEPIPDREPEGEAIEETLGPLPALVAAVEETPTAKKAADDITAGTGESGDPAPISIEPSEKAPGTAGPPAETMLAYAGAGVVPGILSVGSEPGEGDGLVPAVAVSLPRPSYPRVCRRRGQEGTVVLSVVIDADGRPGRIQVVDTSGFTRLDKAARDALKMAVFTPAIQDGLFTESVKQIAFTFRLEDEGN